MGDDSRPVDQPEAGQAPSTPSGEGGGRQATISIGQLVQDHHREVFRYAYRLVGRVPDAEDLTQQTFLIAQQKIGQIRDPRKASHWLMAVVRNCFLKSLRKRRPTLAAGPELEHVSVEPPGAQDVDSELLQAALNELPDQHRLILVMFYFDELSYKEMASELEVPMGTVMSRLARAKVRLRELLMAREKPV